MKQVSLQFISILLTMLLLVIVWEFWIEDFSGDFLPNGGISKEPFSVRVEYVLTIVSFMALALIYPFIQAVRFETNHQKIAHEREQLIAELQTSISEVKTLRGIIQICSYCKNIKNDDQIWTQPENYIHQHSEADFSHGICPECAVRVRKEMNLPIESGPKET